MKIADFIARVNQSEKLHAHTHLERLSVDGVHHMWVYIRIVEIVDTEERPYMLASDNIVERNTWECLKMLLEY